MGCLSKSEKMEKAIYVQSISTEKGGGGDPYMLFRSIRRGGPRDPSRAVNYLTGHTGARGGESESPRLRHPTTEPSTGHGLDDGLWEGRVRAHGRGPENQQLLDHGARSVSRSVVPLTAHQRGRDKSVKLFK
uniref:Uncharacterized protein n=1 Tax=Solanum tuberosum TaxID=4113 RepID=M1ANV9_SOLTU